VPVISLSRNGLSKFVGRSLSVEEMVKWLPWIGLDIEETGTDYVKVEFNPNRVDYSSYVGVARAFKGLMDWETGIPEYEVLGGTARLRIDSSVREVRPYMLAAIARDLDLDEDMVQQIMEIQEDLHWGVGRNRSKASIGVHNLDNVTAPFNYLAVHPDEARFVPLGKTEEMTLREILEKHEKGIAYKSLIDWSPTYPLLMDSKRNVLSMPPVINGELTKVDVATENLFLDVTGPDFKAVEQSLNVLVTALADMGGTIESVEVRYPDRVIKSPNLTPQTMTLRQLYANTLLGLKLSKNRIIKCLRRCRFDAKSTKGGVIEVRIPAYRIDILHEADLVEEVAIGYGYFRLEPSKPATIGTGNLHQATRLSNLVRQVMIGLGFTEVMNFVLSNRAIQFEKMERKPEKSVKIANPVSSEYDIARLSLLPSLMKNLMDNRHEGFPQKVFEVSDVIRVNMKTDRRTERELRVAGLSSHSTAGFSEIKSTVEAVLTDLCFREWEIQPMENPSFTEGRAAQVTVERDSIGLLGEVSPKVITNFDLENPVCAFELSLESLLLYDEWKD